MVVYAAYNQIAKFPRIQYGCKVVLIWIPHGLYKQRDTNFAVATPQSQFKYDTFWLKGMEDMNYIFKLFKRNFKNIEPFLRSSKNLFIYLNIIFMHLGVQW